MRATFIGFALHFSGPIAAVVWLPAGVATAFLAVCGLGFWPGALLGDVLANDYSVLPVAGAIPQTVGNLAEVVLAAWLVRRLMRGGPPLKRTSGVAGLLLLSVGLAAMCIGVGQGIATVIERIDG